MILAITSPAVVGWRGVAALFDQAGKISILLILFGNESREISISYINPGDYFFG
jgi:hypothetical protein